MVKRRTAKKKPAQITPAYTAAIHSALLTHRPCNASGVAVWVRDVLSALVAHDIRAPNDWAPDWNGGFQMRWYNGGGDHLGNSSKSCSLSILPHDNSYRVTIKASLDKSYRTHDGANSTIPGLMLDQAAEILAIMVELVDKAA